MSERLFIVRAGGLTRNEVETAILAARIPDVEEIREQFQASAKRLLSEL